MKYLLIRHAATDANRLTRALQGKHGAPLNEAGRKQAAKLKQELVKRGIDFSQPVAVSDFIRTQETARLAGFTDLNVNKIIDEINTGDPKRTQEGVEQGKLPKEAIEAAQAILRNLPEERIWVTHGLVIAALLTALGQSDPEHFIPSQASITEIEI